jgi:hypothetical protein
MDGFQRAQHRPVLLQYGPRIPLLESIPKPRWNFTRANWETFATDIDHVTQFITACSSAYNRPRGFRKEYIPGWEENCENLYQEYQSTHERGLANDLLRELNDQRKQKWEKTVESINFTHSSRKAWALL